MKPQDKFNLLHNRYINAYREYNGFKPFNVWYKDGWVYVRGQESTLANKYRVSQFEKMTETLEERIKTK